MNQTPNIIKAAAVFINEKGETLLSMDKGSTKWQSLGGKIEKGETPIEALKREMQEELAVNITVNEEQYAESPIFTAANDPGKTVKLLYYICEMLDEPQFVENVEQLHWFSKSECESGDFTFAESTQKFLIPRLIEDGLIK